MEEYITFFIKPGEFFISGDPVIIKTLVGSCVAVCIHDKINHIGGLNHYLLPTPPSSEKHGNSYGTEAIPNLINGIISKGGRKSYFLASIIGGANNFQNGLNIGERNIQIARDILAKNNIKVVTEEVGGHYGRMIYFYPTTNKIIIKIIGKSYKSEKNIAKDKSLQLSIQEFEKLKKVFNDGFKRAEKSISLLINEKTYFQLLEITFKSMDYVQNYIYNKFQNFIINTKVHEKEPLGEVVLLSENKKIEVLINFLFQRDLNTPLIYDELETSAILEIFNILINAILGTLANSLKFDMELRIPLLIKTKEELAQVNFMKEIKNWKKALALKIKMIIPNINFSTILLFLLELSSPFLLFERLK